MGMRVEEVSYDIGEKKGKMRYCKVKEFCTEIEAVYLTKREKIESIVKII